MSGGPDRGDRLQARGVTLRHLPLNTDARGALSFGEVGGQLPFLPRRYFAITGIPAGAVRGDHAHRECHQFLVCLRGACLLHVDDGTVRDEVLLDSPGLGVHAPPLTWCTLHLQMPGTVMLVLASDPYQANDYIHDYDEFLRMVQSMGQNR